MSSDLEFESEPEWLSESDLDDLQINPQARSYKLSDVWNIEEEKASEVAETLAISKDMSFFLLNTMKWRKDELVDAFINGSFSPAGKFEESTLQKVSAVVCPICTERSKGVHLGCGHKVCSDCFYKYVEHKIPDLDIFSATCPGDLSCKRIVGPSMVSHLPNYKAACAQIFLKFQKNFVGCPGNDCDLFYELNGADISCSCGSDLCGNCGYFKHSPLKCNLLEQWLKLLDNDKEILLKANSNTKPCPKCNLIIEKQVGCSHMSCVCGYEFCWQCLGQWVSYGHQCARYEEPVKKKNDLKRFSHYASHHSWNAAAARYHTEVVSNDDTFELPHKTLRDARNLISWTFVLLFYVSYSNQRLILEDNVVNLEQAAEKLEELVRQAENSQEIIRVTSFVNERIRVLQDFATTTKWKYNTSN